MPSFVDASRHPTVRVSIRQPWLSFAPMFCIPAGRAGTVPVATIEDGGADSWLEFQNVLES